MIPRFGPRPAAVAETTPERDDRFTIKHKYTYDNTRRLTEDAYIRNDGKPGTRYTYEYKANQEDVRVYAADGSLSQHYMNILDEKGLAKEHTIFDPKTDAIKDKYSYEYSFDGHGNWIKRTDSRVRLADENTKSAPISIIYRTITYY